MDYHSSTRRTSNYESSSTASRKNDSYSYNKYADRYGFNDKESDYQGYSHRSKRGFDSRPGARRSENNTFVSSSSGKEYSYTDQKSSYNQNQNNRKRDYDSHRNSQTEYSPKPSTSTLIKIANLNKKIGAHNIRGYIENISECTLVSVDLRQDQNSNECYVEFQSLHQAENFMRNHDKKINLNNVEYDMSYVDKSKIKGTREYKYEQERLQKIEDMKKMRENRILQDKLEENSAQIIRNLNQIQESTPCPVIHCQGLYKNTAENHVRASFEYVSKYPIINIRMNKNYESRYDSCYVEFSCIQHAKEVLEYLQNATPKFHVDGAILKLSYSKLANDVKFVNPAALGAMTALANNAALANTIAAKPKPLYDPAAEKNKKLNQMQNIMAAAQWNNTKNDFKPNYEDPYEVQIKDQAKKKKKKKREQEPAFAMQEFKFEPKGKDVASLKVRMEQDQNQNQNTIIENTSSSKIEQTSNQPMPMQNIDSLIETADHVEINYEEKAQLSEIYQTKPDPKNFQYDPDSGYMYDKNSGFYYDKPTNGYYDSSHKIWMTWDDNMGMFVKMEEEDNNNSGNTQKSAAQTEADIKASMRAWEKDTKKKIKKKAEERQEQAKSMEDLEKQHAMALIAIKDSQAMIKNKEEAEEGTSAIPADNDVEWDELICNLCRRAFPTKEKLSRHVEQSKLHKSNFAIKYGTTKDVIKNTMDPTVQKVLEITAQQRELEYKDRMENSRTERYNSAHKDVSNRSREKNSKHFKVDGEQASVHKHIDVSKNIGGKLMEKMGWREGQALGATGDGLVNPINATNVRPKGVGFGHEDAKKSGKERNKKKKFDHYAQGARQAAQDRFRQMYEEGY